MADPKGGKSAKPAAPAPSGGNGHVFTFQLIFLIIVILAVMGIFQDYGLFTDESDNNQNSGVYGASDDASSTDELSDSSGSQIKLSSFSRIFPTGSIVLGNEVSNKKDIDVRISPGGQIIGTQKVGTDGVVIQGPVSKFEKEWWRIDYEKAPDGWVLRDEVTEHVGWFAVFNFFPWLFKNLRVILIFVGVVALIVVVILSVKRRAIYKTVQQKKALKKEQSQVKVGVAKNDSLKNVIPGKTDDSLKVPEGLPIKGLPFGDAPKTVDVTNRRWRNIQTLIHSHNANDWRQAIIESDIILDEMLDKMGYHGDSIGDKLKQVESSDFLTLNQAWEAHKVRNRIAHQGNGYVLSKDEAERVIELYEEVFNEFYFI